VEETRKIRKEIVKLLKKSISSDCLWSSTWFGTLGKTGAGAGEEQGIQDGD
jgi:glycine C-acetyltransferase